MHFGSPQLLPVIRAVARLTAKAKTLTPECVGGIRIALRPQSLSQGVPIWWLLSYRRHNSDFGTTNYFRIDDACQSSLLWTT